MNYLEWKRQCLSEITLYNAKTEYNTFEIRSWPIDESGEEGRFQVCMNEYHKGNCKTLSDAKEFCEQLERFN